MTVGASLLLLVIGVSMLLRAVIIVATGSRGRFPADPWISLVIGFLLVLAGQALLSP